MKSTSKIQKLASRLLATTCLTVGTGAVAVAGTYTGPYGSTFGAADNVGSATTITGTVTFNQPSQEWFEIEGLPGGTSLSSVLSLQDVSGNGITYSVETDTGTVITNGGISSPNFAALSGSVPIDGNVVIGIDATNEASSNWQVNVTASTPEPATVAAVGIGLTGLAAFGLRRRKKA